MRVFDRERTGGAGVCGLRSFLLSGLIAVAAMLPFLAAVGFGLVDLDDGSYLGDHPVLWEGSFIETLKFAFGAAHDAIWMPLTWLSYALDYRLWGEWWGGFHLHSIVVHAVNAVQCVRRWPELPRFLLPGTVLLLAYAGFCACRFRGRLRAWRGTARIVRTCDFPIALGNGFVQ